MYGEGGGETGERILFSLESRFLLRVHIRRRKEEENAPIRNERRMFLPSLVSHSLPRIDAQGTHHRLPKKKTVGNATTRVPPCFLEKKWRNESPDLLLVSFRRRQTINRQPRFALCSRQFPPHGKQSRKKSLHFSSPLFKLPSLIPSPFSKSKQKQESRTGGKKRKKTFVFLAPSFLPTPELKCIPGKEFDNHNKTFLQLISFAMRKKYWFY